MSRETLIYYGDGIRAPGKNELVGCRVNVHGKTGVVVESDALSVTVEWDCTNWLRRLIRWIFGRKKGVKDAGRG